MLNPNGMGIYMHFFFLILSKFRENELLVRKHDIRGKKISLNFGIGCNIIYHVHVNGFFFSKYENLDLFTLTGRA